MRRRCGVAGCQRRADTVIEGYYVRTGEALPSGYSCDDPAHQYVVAMAILPEGQPLPNEAFAADVRRALAAWNEEEARRA